MNQFKKEKFILLNITGHNSKKFGGLEEHWAYLAQKLKSLNCGELYLIENNISSVNQYIKDKLSLSGWNIINIEFSPRRSIISFIPILKIILKTKPTILHVHFSPIAYIAILAGKITGVKKIFWTKHSRLLIKRYSKTWILHRLFIPLVSKVICVSRSVSDELKSLGLFNRNIIIVPLGVNLERFSCNTDKDTKLQLRMELGLSSEDFVVTAISQARPAKRTDIFIKGISEAIKTSGNNKIKGILVGGGPLEEDNKKLAKLLDIENNILFLGVREDVERIYAISDLAVLTSSTEGLPLALVEGGASGLPLAGTNVGGIPEVIIDGYNGYLFKVGDFLSLSQIIIDFLINPDKRDKMGLNSKKFISEKYNIENCVSRLIDLYFN